MSSSSNCEIVPPKVDPSIFSQQSLFLAKEHFNVADIQQGQQIIDRKNLCVSFKKGNADSYFIISGIVREISVSEARLTFKKVNSTLNSNCNCLNWKEHKHCGHVAALFLKFFQLEEQYEHNSQTNGNVSRSYSHTHNYDEGVHVHEYGQIEEGAHKLKGAIPSATYLTQNYILSNKQVVAFPLPEIFKGKLIINLIRVQPDNYLKYCFSYRDINDELISEISLFERLYLMVWKNGHVYHLPTNLKEFITKIKSKGLYIKDFNDVLRDARDCIDLKLLEVHYEGEDVNTAGVVEYQPIITIAPGNKRNFLRMSIAFHAAQTTKVLPIPSIFKAFAYEGGLFSSFQKKNHGPEFFSMVVQSFEGERLPFKKYYRNSTQRDLLASIVEYFFNYNEEICFDEISKQKIIYNLDSIKILLSALYFGFPPGLIRYSGLIHHGFSAIEVFYEFQTQVILQGIPSLYNKLHALGYQIFYDQVKVHTWNNQLQFERRGNGPNWFELNVNINPQDWAVLVNLDENESYSFGQQGLVLLSDKQKEMLKFLKRYINWSKLPGKNKEKMLKENKGKKIVLSLGRARIFELFELHKLGLENALTPEELLICEKLMNLEELPQYEISPLINATPRSYQMEGHRWLNFLYESKLGACLADDMGLGKTLQTIMFLQKVIDTVSRILIVCPVSIILNWKKELEKFSQLESSLYYGGERVFPSEAKIILTSYGVMKKESESVLSHYHFDILVLDEVQHLKNIKSLGAKAARNLSANFRICLTGTPVENDLIEFYNILDLCVPGIWGNLLATKGNFDKESRYVARKTARPFILRRTKDQVLKELPDKIDNLVYLNFSPEEEQHYQAKLISVRENLKMVGNKHRYGEVLKSLLQLRQMCLWQNWEEESKNENALVESTLKKQRSTKVEFLLETLEQIIEENHQVLVFSQFTTYLDIIQAKIKERGWKYGRIDGEQSLKRRNKEIEAFQEGKNRIFLVSLRAGGVGLNLTAASYIFIMDPWWNPAVESQAIDRAHRIGQQNVLNVYRPVIKNSVEEKVLELQKMKQELFKDLMNTDDAEYFSGKLTMSDFEDLFA